MNGLEAITKGGKGIQRTGVAYAFNLGGWGAKVVGMGYKYDHNYLELPKIKYTG